MLTLRSLLVVGVVAGVGGVLTFLPNILLLFLAIAFLEDSGYMARAAFIMDRLMHAMGLHGKSFIPMLIGFGCTVPAYMATRTLEDRKSRLLTMHVCTFMSCGARLPVYVLMAGAFWPERQAGWIVWSLYILGIILAVAAAKVLRVTRFKGESAPFVMELPPYRMPTLKGTLIHVWERAWLYLRKAGTIILAVSIVMWALMTFPQTESYSKDYAALRATAQTDGREELVAQLVNEQAAEDLRYSAAGRIGRALEPFTRPLGFDWRLDIGIVGGFAAKEVIVATMGQVYAVGADQGEQSETLRERLRSDPAYSPLIAYAFLVFVLTYFPCMSAMAVFLRESASWKETLFQMGYTTALAYALALIVYQGGGLLGLG